MRKNFQKTISSVLALLVLVSTFSFAIDKHFCGDFLVDIAVFSEAETCGMAMHNSPETGMAEDSCCTNEKVAVEGQDELKVSFDSLNFDQQVFLSSFTFSYLNLFEGLPQHKIPFKDYSPPLLVSDIHVLDQVFLI